MHEYRIGHGYDVHRLAEGEELWIGGIQIEHEKGLVAHSDGDVAIHALCDALLGAAAMGDIGLHFPDTSSEFKDISSVDLLKDVSWMLSKAGLEVVNVDITIVMQRPKLRPYIDTMRTILAEAMEIQVNCVSIKATTTEKLGFVGREEGVEAHAVAMLKIKPY